MFEPLNHQISRVTAGYSGIGSAAPADVFEGRRNEILDQRALVKARTMTKRKIHNLRLSG
jgi:hypothetical protein